MFMLSLPVLRKVCKYGNTQHTMFNLVMHRTIIDDGDAAVRNDVLHWRCLFFVLRNRNYNIVCCVFPDFQTCPPHGSDHRRISISPINFHPLQNWFSLSILEGGVSYALCISIMVH